MREKLWNTAKVRLFKLDYELVLSKLKEYARHALEKGAKEVILIGSLARGDYTSFSDADVVVISDNVPQRVLDRLTIFMDPTLPIALEPMVYTTQEFLKMAEEKRKLVVEVVEHGVLLAGGGEVVEKAKEILQGKR